MKGTGYVIYGNVKKITGKSLKNYTWITTNCKLGTSLKKGSYIILIFMFTNLTTLLDQLTT